MTPIFRFREPKDSAACLELMRDEETGLLNLETGNYEPVELWEYEESEEFLLRILFPIVRPLDTQIVFNDRPGKIVLMDFKTLDWFDLTWDQFVTSIAFLSPTLTSRQINLLYSHPEIICHPIILENLTNGEPFKLKNYLCARIASVVRSSPKGFLGFLRLLKGLATDLYIPILQLLRLDGLLSSNPRTVLDTIPRESDDQIRERMARKEFLRKQREEMERCEISFNRALRGLDPRQKD
jgi:hypothetical protein